MAEQQPNPVDTGTVDAPTNPAETAERRALVVDLHHAGKTFQQIGDQLGVSRQRAHFIYWDTIDAIPARSVEAARTAQTEMLSEVVRVAAEVMASEHLAHSNGRLITKTDGTAVLDDGPKLDAGRTIIAALARLAKTLGTDAPVKTEVDLSGGVRYEVVGVDPGGVV